MRTALVLLLAGASVQGFLISPLQSGLQRHSVIAQKTAAFSGGQKLQKLCRYPNACRISPYASAGASVAKDVWSMAGVGFTTVQRPFGGEPGADVTTLRHDEYGTGLELWQGSFGWFDFVSADGAAVILCDTWAVQVERPSQVFSSAAQYSALRQQANKDKALNKLKGTVQAGCWTFKEQGRYVVIENKNSKRQTLVLTPEGFVFIGSRGRAIVIQQANPSVQNFLASYVCMFEDRMASQSQ